MLTCMCVVSLMPLFVLSWQLFIGHQSISIIVLARQRAATTIARAVLVWGAREQVATRRHRKEEMLAEMAAIEHDAWVRYVRAQQEQERQRLAAIAEIKAKRAKRMALEQVPCTLLAHIVVDS